MRLFAPTSLLTTYVVYTLPFGQCPPPLPTCRPCPITKTSTAEPVSVPSEPLCAHADAAGGSVKVPKYIPMYISACARVRARICVITYLSTYRFSCRYSSGLVSIPTGKYFSVYSPIPSFLAASDQPGNLESRAAMRHISSLARPHIQFIAPRRRLTPSTTMALAFPCPVVP